MADKFVQQFTWTGVGGLIRGSFARLAIDHNPLYQYAVWRTKHPSYYTRMYSTSRWLLWSLVTVSYIHFSSLEVRTDQNLSLGP
jgi:hypothetical protein